MIHPPLEIGGLGLASNLLLAPIAGYCDLAFRTVCREQGGLGLACTDLLSPQGLLRGTATSLDLARTDRFDKPVGMQLYGSDPEIMAQGARWAAEHGATLIDINMGCPVDKVTKKDGGSKLLTDLDRAVGIAARVVREMERVALSHEQWQERLGDAVLRRAGPCPIPVTCKMRLCWHTSELDSGAACSPLLARRLADAGVAAVTVHGRTTEMKFSGQVRHDGIARVVESVGGAIPVIGNGDVREPEDCVDMMRRTGCRGVMIGRGALSAPWIFRRCWELQAGGAAGPEPGTAEKIGIIRRYFELMRANRDDRYAMFQITRRISWFARRLMEHDPSGRPIGIKPFKEAVRHATEPAQVHAALDRFLAGELRGGFFELQEPAST